MPRNSSVEAGRLLKLSLTRFFFLCQREGIDLSNAYSVVLAWSYWSFYWSIQHATRFYLTKLCGHLRCTDEIIFCVLICSTMFTLFIHVQCLESMSCNMANLLSVHTCYYISCTCMFYGFCTTHTCAMLEIDGMQWKIYYKCICNFILVLFVTYAHLLVFVTQM